MLSWWTTALISLVDEVFQHCDSRCESRDRPIPSQDSICSQRWLLWSLCVQVGCLQLLLLVIPALFPLVGSGLASQPLLFPKQGPCSSLLLPQSFAGRVTPGCPCSLPLQAASCRERCCLCPGHGRDKGTVQSFLTREGSFFPAAASFPSLSPRLSSPLAAAMVPVCSSPLISKPPGSPGAGHAGPAPLFPSSCLPQQSQHPCSRRGRALCPAGEPFPQLYPSVWARGRQSVSAAHVKAGRRALGHFPFVCPRFS